MWCENVITIWGSEESMNRFYQQIQDEFRFGKTVPVTTNELDSWGTKWEIDESKVRTKTSNKFIIECNTICNPPIKWAENFARSYRKNYLEINVKIFFMETNQQYY